MSSDFLQRLMRRAVGTEPIGAIFKVSFEDWLQDEQGRHLHHSISHRWNPERSHLSVGLRYVYAPHRLWLVGFRLQGFLNFFNKPAYARFPPFDLFDRNAVHAGCSLIGAHPPPCLFQCVPPIDPVVQHVKPELRFLLRLLMQLLSQQREFLRHPGVIHACMFRFLRSVVSQSGSPFLLLSACFQ
jgi:hypothetical protein